MVEAVSFSDLWSILKERMNQAPLTHPGRWQGVDVKNNPAAATYELLNVSIQVPLSSRENLDHWRQDVRPNLPWADDHFLERVSGEPLNPGVQWANWPWARSADKFRDGTTRFNHTYMERYWPKNARGETASWIGAPFGDLNDLVDLLVRDPDTRQAWIPIFFPTDTGWADGGRKPCTLGYQFIMRNDQLHVWYPLRSCDLYRHFRDDVYLTIRLLLWVLARCREKDPVIWRRVTPGIYAMHCTSLHVFQYDRSRL